MNTRRRFIAILPWSGVALLAACGDKAAPPAPAPAPAPAPQAEAPAPAAPAAPVADLPPLSEQDPAAQGLGYVADASRADTAKYKQYAAGQLCSNCALYAGAPGAASGPCPLFAGRSVAAAGWCGSYVKKVG
jgi:hypothetical protein